MGVISRVVGQAKPSAATPVDLYTVPLNTQFQGNLVICNQTAILDYFRVALRVGGAVLGVAQYLSYDEAILQYTSQIITGICLSPGDVVTIYSTNGGLSFNLTGLEIS